MATLDPNFLSELDKSLTLFRPEMALIVTFVVAIIADLIFKKARKISGVVSLIGLIATGGIMLTASGPASYGFEQLLIVDPFAIFFKYIFLLSGVIVILMSFFSDEIYAPGRSVGEYYSLIVGMTIGMFAICGSGNLIMIYLALETMSLSSYVLAGYTKEIRRASEASLKYVIFGSLASGIMIYGISLIFGLTGSLNLNEIQVFLQNYHGSSLPLVVSGLMVLAGIGYKISAVPFHFWTPDVYEGATVSISAYLSVASKAAGFALLVRFLKMGYIDPVASQNEYWEVIKGIDWKYIIAVLAVVTMTIGNLVALWQNNVKRMLGYSSIAHAGYLLMAVAVMSASGNQAILIYFFTYMIMNFGAFYVVQLIANKIGSEDLDDYVGLGYRAPGLGVAMTIFMVSLTGLPPTAGFIGKLFLFKAVLDSGMMWLAIIGVLNSVVSLYYYAKVFRNMWVRGTDGTGEALNYSAASQILMYVLAFATLWYGLFFTPIVAWAANSVTILIGK